ncbi:hypothetical protein B0H14DRAFT_2731952 [Mycena olivaceomarginata]|nr:hypothetical protein B0H14DRAFT_2731952 [Mycena olivaceomarginata]
MDNFEGIRTAMENTCVDWLIALLSTLALAPNNQRVNIISAHQQYLHALAQLEQEAALQGGYIHSPMTFLSYAKITAEFRSVTDLLLQSIVAENLSGHKIPSGTQVHLAETLGRFMAEWSAAGQFIEPRAAHKRYLAVVLLRRRSQIAAEFHHAGEPGAGPELPSLELGQPFAQDA